MNPEWNIPVLYLLYGIVQGILVTRFASWAPKEVAFVCFLTIFAPIISLVLILSLIHQVILFLIGGKADENI